MKRVLLILVCTILALQLAGPASAAKPWDVGQPALDFTVKNFTEGGKEFTLSKVLKKNFVMFTYFASTCSSCRSEIGDLIKAAGDGSIDRDNVTMLFISIDFNESFIPGIVENLKLKDYTVLHDPNFVSPRKYGIGSTPATVIIDKQGNIAFRTMGYGPEVLDQIVKTLR